MHTYSTSKIYIQRKREGGEKEGTDRTYRQLNSDIRFIRIYAPSINIPSTHSRLLEIYILVKCNITYFVIAPIIMIKLAITTCTSVYVYF